MLLMSLNLIGLATAPVTRNQVHSDPLTPSPADVRIVFSSAQLEPIARKTTGGIPGDAVLVQERKGGWSKIESINDLKGHYQVRNMIDALEFVRLITSPATCLRASGVTYEIVPRTAVNLRFCLGDAKTLGFVLRNADGAYGITSAKWFADNRLCLPKVKQN